MQYVCKTVHLCACICVYNVPLPMFHWPQSALHGLGTEDDLERNGWTTSRKTAMMIQAALAA